MTKRHDRQWRVDWLVINYKFLNVTSKRLWCRSRNFASGLLSAGIRQSSMNSALSLSDVNLCLNVTRLSAKSKRGTQFWHSFRAFVQEKVLTGNVFSRLSLLQFGLSEGRRDEHLARNHTKRVNVECRGRFLVWEVTLILWSSNLCV